MDDCPSRDLLRSLGEPDVEAPAGLGDHLDRCRRCRSYLERLARSGSHAGSLSVEYATAPTIPGLSRLERIGEGGSAVVYRAEHDRLATAVAVKVLKPGRPGSRSRRSRVLKEARAAALVKHHGILPVYDVGQAGDACYIVMEFAGGGTLAERLAAEGPVAAEVAASVGLQIAEAIAAVHLAGLVHCDLKPSNIMFREASDIPLGRCRPLIGDFETAGEAGKRDAAEGWLAFGTPGYMAPELAPGSPRPVDERADVYSLGAVLFRMVAGRPPHAGPTPEATLRSIAEEDAPPLGDLVPDVPWTFEAIVAACLRRRPDDRLASASDLAAELRRFLGEETRAEASRAKRRPDAPARRRLAAATIALGSTLGIWAAYTTPGAERKPTVVAAAPGSTPDLARIEAAAAAVALPPDAAPKALVEAGAAARRALAESRASLERRPRDRRGALAHVRLAHGLGRLEKRAGDDSAALLLDAEALRVAESWLARRPGDVEVVATAAEVLRLHAWDLLRARRLEESERAQRRRRALLESLPSTPDRPADLLEARVWGAIAIKAGGRIQAAVQELEKCLAEADGALDLSPGSARLWGLKGSILVHLSRDEEAVQALRRCVELDPSDAGRAVHLARSLFSVARWRTPIEGQPKLLDEVEALVARHAGRVGRRGDGRRPLSIDEGAEWEKVRTALADERMRVRVALDFDAGLASAIAAEDRRRGGPTDGGWLAAASSDVAAEHRGLAGRRGWRSEAQERHGRSAPGCLEWGVALIATGDPDRGRVLVARGLALAGAVRWADGELPGADRLCDLAIEGFGHAAAPIVPDDDQLAIRSEPIIWTQAARVRWEIGDLPRVREAIARTVEAAERLFRSPFDDGTGPAELDLSLRRLARFEAESGDLDAATAALRRCLALWPADSAQAERVRRCFDELAAEPEARQGADAITAAR